MIEEFYLHLKSKGRKKTGNVQIYYRIFSINSREKLKKRKIRIIGV